MGRGGDQATWLEQGGRIGTATERVVEVVALGARWQVRSEQARLQVKTKTVVNTGADGGGGRRQRWAGGEERGALWVAQAAEKGRGGSRAAE